MIEKLENQLEEAQKSSSSSVPLTSNNEELSKAKSRIEELKRALLQMQENRDSLLEKLENQISSKDSDSEERILHFKRNPTELAFEERRHQVQRLTDENDALKARVKLLEEGHTGNLTLLVGQKMEEGASSQEVEGE